MIKKVFLTGAILVGLVFSHNLSAQSSGSATTLPQKFVGGYLEAWSSDLPDSVSSSYDMLLYAFANVDGAGNVYMPNTSGNRSALASQIKARKVRGNLILLSIAGSNGAQSGLTTSSQVNNFVSTIIPIIDEFGFAGVDWDFEQNTPGGIGINGIIDASRQLRAHYGNSFIISIAPYGGTESIYKEIAKQLNSTGDLTYVGYQFYNWGSIPDDSFVRTKIQSWMSYTGINPSQFVIGFWYGPDDYLGLVTPYSNMVSVWNSISATYPTIRGVYTWAISETDKPSNYSFANTMTPVVKIFNPTSTPTPTPNSFPGDINLDRIVNSLDWSIMSSNWLTNHAASDLNKDGVVNSLDWSLMSSNWLKTW
ncbi:MAG: glycosyl hydrolase family 18 protein [Minisyncoccia bacterium]